MNNIKDLRNELMEVFQGLRAGTISPKDAKEITNAAGKIINSAKVEMEYKVIRKEKPTIKFLESE